MCAPVRLTVQMTSIQVRGEKSVHDELRNVVDVVDSVAGRRWMEVKSRSEY